MVQKLVYEVLLVGGAGPAGEDKPPAGEHFTAQHVDESTASSDPALRSRHPDKMGEPDCVLAVGMEPYLPGEGIQREAPGKIRHSIGYDGVTRVLADEDGDTETAQGLHHPDGADIQIEGFFSGHVQSIGIYEGKGIGRQVWIDPVAASRSLMTRYDDEVEASDGWHFMDVRLYERNLFCMVSALPLPFQQPGREVHHEDPVYQGAVG